MKSVIYIAATNPRVCHSGTIFKPNLEGHNTQLGDVTFLDTSNLPLLSTNDTIIASLPDENIVIRTLVPYISPFPKNYLKRDFEEEM